MRLGFGVGTIDVGFTGGVSDAADGGLLSSTFLSNYGPYGMVMDFTDASISINDETDVLDYSSQGTVSATTGALLGPGSKLVYSAPSAKLTEQADGYLAFQAHNLLQYSEAHGTAPWNTSSAGTGVAPTRTNGYAAGPFGGSATRLQFSLGGGTTTSDLSTVQQSVTTVTGGEYTRDVWIRSTDGSSSYVMQVQAIDGAATNVAVTGAWTKYTVTGISGGVLSISLRLRGGQTTGAGANSNTADVLVANDHLRRTPSASTYVATTSAAVYDLPYVFSGGVRTGIMVEPAATNLCLRSNDFTDASWGKFDLTVTPNSILSPDGSVNGALLTMGTAGTGAFTQIVTATPTNAHTHYFVMKRGNNDWVLLQLGGTGTERGRVWFNLATGSVGTAANVAPATGTSGTIRPLGNDWYLCTITSTVGGAGSTISTVSLCTSADNSLTRVNNSTHYVWLAQLETGTVATSPIITYGAAVTRAADNSLKVAVANFPVGTAHTLYMHLQRPEKDVQGTFLTLQGASTDFIQLIDDSASLRGVVRTVADGVTATLSLATENALNTPFKIAISADTTADGVHNAGPVVSDPACVCATSFATLDIGHASLTRPMLVKAVAYLPARRTGAQLQEMTT